MVLRVLRKKEAEVKKLNEHVESVIKKLHEERLPEGV